uniref:Uncharacterized protein n=1 Tax=Arundo donax TaxID=35708 RepID=A0A0A9BB38_ARUDO
MISRHKLQDEAARTREARSDMCVRIL